MVNAALRAPCPPLAGGALLSAAFATLVLASSPARGAEALLRLRQATVWEGQSTILELRVTDPPPRISRPQLPAVPGLTFRGPVGPTRQQYSDGTGRSTTFVGFSYEVSAVAGQRGTFRIGPASIPVPGGAALETNAVELRVYKKPPDGVRFSCTLGREGGPVGAPFRIVYTAYYAGNLDDSDEDPLSDPFARSQPLGIQELSMPLLGLRGVRLTPVPVLPDQEARGLRFQDGSQIIVQQGFAEEADGTGYRTLVFGFDAVPLTTGKIVLPSASISLRLRTGRTKVVRDLIFQREVPEVVAYKDSTEEVTYTVRELPAEGRPQGFAGAIGQYRIQVRASPTDVGALDPITLVVQVTRTGEGLLEELRAPNWTEVDSLTKDFEVSSDVDSGKVDGNTKVFQQVIRPRSEKVTAIPPIPFPYYDPAASRYAVTASEPIPIRVHAVKTVGADEAIPSTRAVPSGAGGDRERDLPSTLLERAGIGANFDRLGTVRPALDPRDEVLGVPFLAVLLGPPVLYLLVLVGRRVSRRDPRERARSRALARARAELAAAGSSFDALSDAYQGFFRDRLGLPAGEITPRDLAARLESLGVPEDVRRRAVETLERLLSGRFGGAPGSAEELHARAVETFLEIERSPAARRGRP